MIRERPTSASEHDPAARGRRAGARAHDRPGREWITFDRVPIAGHAHPSVVEAVTRAAGDGLLGAVQDLEIRLAEEIRRVVPSMELCRSATSGEVAVLSALRLAREFTGRAKVLWLYGGHGGHGGYPVCRGPGSGPALGPRERPPAAARDVLLVPWGDLETLCGTMALNAGQIAAVLVEPCLSRLGIVPPPTGYLKEVRELASAEGALLIFDDTSTGWRIAVGSIQTRYGLRPDLTCLGVGCEPPFDCLGGRADVMRRLAPGGPVEAAGGRASGLALTAALVTLKLVDEAAFAHLQELTGRLEAGLEREIARVGVEAVVQRMGASLTLFFGTRRVHDGPSAQALDGARYEVFRRAMFEQGFLLPRSQHAPVTLSLAHGEDDVEAALRAAAKAMEATRC